MLGIGAILLTLHLTGSSPLAHVTVQPLERREPVPADEMRALLRVQHAVALLEERLLTADSPERLLERLDAAVAGPELRHITQAMSEQLGAICSPSTQWEEIVSKVRALVRERLPPAAVAQLEVTFAQDLVALQAVSQAIGRGIWDAKSAAASLAEVDPYVLLSRAPARFGEMFLTRLRGSVAALVLFAAVAAGRSMPDWLALELARCTCEGSRIGLVLTASYFPEFVSEAELPAAERLDLVELTAEQQQREDALSQLVNEARKSGREVWPPLPPELDE